MKDRSDKNDFELIVEMPEEMVAFLDKLVAQLENQGSRQFTRETIVRAVLKAFCENNFDLSGIYSEEQLVE